jgi:hypothetical protein
MNNAPVLVVDCRFVVVFSSPIASHDDEVLFLQEGTSTTSSSTSSSSSSGADLEQEQLVRELDVFDRHSDLNSDVAGAQVNATINCLLCHVLIDGLWVVA